MYLLCDMMKIRYDDVDVPSSGGYLPILTRVKYISVSLKGEHEGTKDVDDQIDVKRSKASSISSGAPLLLNQVDYIYADNSSFFIIQ